MAMLGKRYALVDRYLTEHQLVAIREHRMGDSGLQFSALSVCALYDHAIPSAFLDHSWLRLRS